MDRDRDRPRILIAGGGIAGAEALLALRDLAGAGPEITLISPGPDLVYRPLIVDEAFTFEPAEHRSLGDLAAEMDAEFVLAELVSVDPDARLARLSDGSERSFDFAIVCVGARSKPALPDVLSFDDRQGPAGLTRLLSELARAEGSVPRLAFVVPAGVSWALPIYELALMSHDALAAAGPPPEISIVTPEAAPLIMFGRPASSALAELLSVRGITARCGARVRASDAGGLEILPGGEPLEADRVVALPLLEGRVVDGLPADPGGFLPIDEHCRVAGSSDVYAAGDGASFPIKQGGIGTQMADAAARHIAARLGAEIEPAPFRPVLRGKLFAGKESLYLSQSVAGGGGEGETSPDPLWWPPHKVSGHYISRWLAHEEPSSTAGSDQRPLEVEVALPAEWHETPAMLDPYDVLPTDD